MKALFARWLGNERLARICQNLALFGSVVFVADMVLRLPYRTWSTVRFAWGAGLRHGYDLYYGPNEGPVLASVYGPVGPLTRLPALLVGEITGTILVAGVINGLMAVLPVLALMRWRGAHARHDPSAVRASFAFASLALLSIPATMEIVGHLHVDAQAVGFGLLACGVLSGRESPGWARLTVAATLSVLAVWSKQIEGPVVIAQVVYVWAAFGRTILIRFVVCLAVIGLAISLAFGWIFGFQELWFNLITIPGSHPVAATGGILLEILLWALPFIVIIVAVQFARPPGSRRWLQQDWVLPALAALFLLPLNVMARAKVGGWVNSYHCLYYIVVAAALAVRAAPEALGKDRARGFSTGLLVLLLAITPLQQLRHGAGRGFRYLPQISSNPERQLSEFARSHPGEVYLPWNPLASLDATGELHHFAHALYDRALAGFPVSDEHFRAHLPEHMRWIVFPRGYPTSYVLPYLPEFSHRTKLAELPGWVVYTRVLSSE